VVFLFLEFQYSHNNSFIFTSFHIMPAAVLFEIDKDERRGQIDFCLTFVGDQKYRKLSRIDDASLKAVCETLHISASRDERREKIDHYLRTVPTFPLHPEHPQVG
jgi:hypothetical protein